MEKVFVITESKLKELLKEQRNICTEEAKLNSHIVEGYMDEEKIYYAPEPTLPEPVYIEMDDSEIEVSIYSPHVCTVYDIGFPREAVKGAIYYRDYILNLITKTT